MRSSKPCASLLLGLSSITVVHAAGTNISMNAGSSGGNDNFFVSSSALTATGSVFSTGPLGHASAGMDIGMGEVHVKTEAVANGPSASRSKTDILANALDEVTAHGAFDGQKVVVRWTMPISGGGSSTGDAVLDGFFEFFTQSFYDNQGLTYRDQVVNGASTFLGYYGGLASVDVTYEAGQTYNMALTYHSTIDVVGTNGAAAGLFDFSHTGHAYAEVLTPSATLSSASGHVYAQPVPEPASMAALGLGTLALVQRRRRGPLPG
jgi:hypothetical protein